MDNPLQRALLPIRRSRAAFGDTGVPKPGGERGRAGYARNGVGGKAGGFVRHIRRAQVPDRVKDISWGEKRVGRVGTAFGVYGQSGGGGRLVLFDRDTGKSWDEKVYI